MAERIKMSEDKRAEVKRQREEAARLLEESRSRDMFGESDKSSEYKALSIDDLKVLKKHEQQRYNMLMNILKAYNELAQSRKSANKFTTTSTSNYDVHRNIMNNPIHRTGMKGK